MKHLLIIVMAAAVTMASCKGSDANTKRFTVASEKRIGMGVAPQECYLIKSDDGKSWEMFYSAIDGFDYQEGYEYVIDVELVPRENAPADVSSVQYVLKKVVSKTEKHSEGMPEPRDWGSVGI